MGLCRPFGIAQFVPAKAKFFSVIFWPLLIESTKREVKMAGYWPRSFFAFLWTETKSRSKKTQKRTSKIGQ